MDRKHIIQILGDWVQRSFGNRNWTSVRERCFRLLEETVELCQAEGMSREECAAVLNEVFSRPKIGEPYQEAGGVAITLLAYCGTKGFDPVDIEMVELRRILDKPAAHWRNRQQQKADLGIARAPSLEERLG